MGFVLLDLALILTVAHLVGAAFARAGQPRVVGEIAAGILLGPTVLGAPLVEQLYPPEAIAFLDLTGQVGLMLYMFLVGIELDSRLLRGRGKEIALIAAVVVAIPVAFGFAASGLYDRPMWRPEGTAPLTVALFLGAGLSVTAFPVMARILQEKRLMPTAVGAVGVGTAAVVTVLMFLVITTAATVARGDGVAGAMASRIALLATFWAALQIGVRPLISRLIGAWRPGQPVGRIASVLVIGALAAALATHEIGVHGLTEPRGSPASIAATPTHWARSSTAAACSSWSSPSSGSSSASSPQPCRLST